MTLQEKEKAYNRIIGSLDCGELKDAFDAMQSLIAGSRELSFSDDLQELQDTYKYMLRYMGEGIKDPMQEQIYRGVRTSAYALADRIHHRVLATESPLMFYSVRRSLSVGQQTTFRELHRRLVGCLVAGELADYDATLVSLFNRLWVSDPLTTQESVEIRDILFDRELPFAVGCQVVSALLLGMLAAFDAEKLTLLFDAAGMERDDEVRTRALIAVLLTLYVYRRRTALYPQITERLDALAERRGFTRVLRMITLRFILARETEKITHKLQTEILPEMMKLNTNLRNKITMSDITVELTAADMNPEWEKLFKNPSVGKMMEEFGELQEEGADVMHSTFVHLKSFPFFREPGNWFLPFTPRHSSFGKNDMQLPTEMEASPLFCNSDKYSLCFCLLSLPESNRRAIAEHLTSQTAGMKEQTINDVFGREDREEAIVGMYVRDLYRFFKLYPRHLDFGDVFALPLDFHNLSLLRPYISDEESLRSIAEYYLHKNHFSDALTVFLHLAEEDAESDILFQKIGYCKEMDGDRKGALEAYLRADLLNPRSKWVLRRIAGCYRSMKKPEEALKYYRRCEQLSPDDLSVTISIGHCYLELRDYAEALKCFYKADYMDGNPKVWRPIAWCSFLTGKYDQARGYYKKILSGEPNMQDFLNAGHTEWALQNIKGAIELYRKAVETADGDFNRFREEFSRDIADLVAAGIEDGEIPLMMDQLRYTLGESL